jgi:hypothetical protein
MSIWALTDSWRPSGPPADTARVLVKWDNSPSKSLPPLPRSSAWQPQQTTPQAGPRYHFTSAPFRPPEPDIQMGAKAQPRYQHSSLAGDRELQAQDCHLLAAPAEATKESDQPLIIDSIGTAEVTLRG